MTNNCGKAPSAAPLPVASFANTQNFYRVVCVTQWDVNGTAPSTLSTRLNAAITDGLAEVALAGTNATDVSRARHRQWQKEILIVIPYLIL